MVRPDIAERLSTVLTASATRLGMVATVQLATSAGALGEMVQAYRALEHAVPIRYNDISIRTRQLQRGNARKAIHLLARLGRYSPFAPLNPADLYRPEPHRPSRPSSSPNSSPRTANVSERTPASPSKEARTQASASEGTSSNPHRDSSPDASSSSASSLRSPAACPPGALHGLPLTPSLKDDVNDPRASDHPTP